MSQTPRQTPSQTPSQHSSCACDEVLEDLDAYLDRELPDERTAAIREHLLGCASCLAEYSMEREVKTLVARGCGSQHAPPQVHARVRARLRVLGVNCSDKPYRTD